MLVRNAFRRFVLQLLAGAAAISVTIFGFALAQGPQPKATPASTKEAPTPEIPSNAGGSLPKLEHFLKVSMERHPELAVARSKVEFAKAELQRSEASALKELLQLHQRAHTQRSKVETLRNESSGSNSDDAVLAAAAADLSLLEWEIALSMGFQVEGKPPVMSALESRGSTAHSEMPDTVGDIDVTFPKGETADKLKVALNRKIDIDIQESDLRKVCEILAVKSGISFIVAEASLEADGYVLDATPIKINAKGLTLTSVLLQLEDKYSVHFVVRDYGILVGGERCTQDAISARDFGMLSTEEIREQQRARRESARQMRPSILSPTNGAGFY